MPYRRVRKYARKTYRRKKAYRRKRMMGRRARADKGHLEKIVRRFPITIGAAGTAAEFFVHWLATGISGQVEGFFTGGAANASQQFTQCATMYREYYISSLKIEFCPSLHDGGGGISTFVHQMYSGTTMDSMVPGQLQGCLDYKSYKPGTSFKRFYRVAKYAKQKSQIWRSCNDAITGGAGGFNALPNCVTAVVIEADAFAPGTQMGEVTCTWYVRFHHRQRAAN